MVTTEEATTAYGRLAFDLVGAIIVDPTSFTCIHVIYKIGRIVLTGIEETGGVWS